jgi:hypothetical protein
MDGLDEVVQSDVWDSGEMWRSGVLETCAGKYYPDKMAVIL